MAFSDFKTISEVQEKFRITYAEDDFVKAEPSSPSIEFLQDFEFTREHINDGRKYFFLILVPRHTRLFW